MTAVTTHYLTQEPKDLAAQYRKESRLWKAAALITVVAIGLIMAVTTTLIILNAATFSFGFCAQIFAAGVATRLLIECEKYLRNRSNDLKMLANLENEVANELTQIRKNPQNIPSNEIGKLPLIAYCNFWDRRASRSVDAVRSILTSSQHETAEQSKSKIVEYLYAKLKSALMLELIENSNQQIELEQIGNIQHIQSKQIELEQIGNTQHIQSKYLSLDLSSPFFIFNDKQKDPLTYRFALDNPVSVLREKLFS